MMRSVIRSSSGFTLVETMAAMVMLMIVIGAIYGTYRAATASASMAEERADLNQTARILLSQINKDLSSAYQQPGEQASSLEGQSTEGSRMALQHDGLSFLTTAQSTMPVKGPAGDQRKVTYTLETTPDGDPDGFFVSVDPRPGLSVTDEKLEPIELSMLVVGFNCKYLDGDTDEWMDDWTERQTLPKAVRVELLLKAERKDAKPIMVASTVNLNPSEAQGEQGAQ